MHDSTATLAGDQPAALAAPGPELGLDGIRQSGQLAERETFSLSREFEYLSESELEKQIGPREIWPLAIVKELIDNSLDNCEEHGILPEITGHTGQHPNRERRWWGENIIAALETHE